MSASSSSSSSAAAVTFSWSQVQLMMDDAETRGFARGLAESARVAHPTTPDAAASAAATAAAGAAGESGPTFVVSRKRGREGSDAPKVAGQPLFEQLGLEWLAEGGADASQGVWDASSTLGNGNSSHLTVSSVAWFLAVVLDDELTGKLDAALGRLDGVCFSASGTWSEKMKAPIYFGRSVLMSCMQSLARMTPATTRNNILFDARKNIATTVNAWEEPMRSALLRNKRATSKESPRALFARVPNLDVVPRCLLQTYLQSLTEHVGSYTGTDDNTAVELVSNSAHHPDFAEAQADIYEILLHAMCNAGLFSPGNGEALAMHMAGRLALASIQPDAAESKTVRSMWGTNSTAITNTTTGAAAAAASAAAAAAATDDLFDDDTVQQSAPASPEGVAAAAAAAAAVVAADAAAEAIIAEGDFGIDMSVADAAATAPEDADDAGSEPEDAYEEDEIIPATPAPKKRRRTAVAPGAPRAVRTRAVRSDATAQVSVPDLDLSASGN